MRWIGLGLLIMAGCGCGWLAAARLRQRAASLDRAIRWLRFLKTEFRFHATPLTQALEAAAKQESLRGLIFLRPQGEPGPPAEALAERIRKWASALALTPADVALLTDACAGLGTTDLEGQLAHLELYILRLEERRAEAETVSQQKGRVFLVLGLTGSATAALLLL